jgi:hypothetical protein
MHGAYDVKIIEDVVQNRQQKLKI